jgi:ketosteroid isomerase-like protein
MSDWIAEYFADVDAMRLDAYVARHTDDASVVFANNPPAVGKPAIRDAIGGFWSVIGGLRHERKNLWLVNGGDSAVLETLVHYVTKGGKEVALPCVSLLDRRGELVSSLRVHIDLTPLFAEIATESTVEVAR